ncbi:MAG: hypothetical protein AAGU21_10445 [Solidesulfovibrio sp.]|uniref:hypothetical protein n=1 Tax=Solidesulfovibrio sp. TaxID=2910990 RepID=UPI002B2118F2|nr:hypothetical protein [Solidesulfovibrio sp.]MEA4856762.1 hypothetical protein [Solidesulfovibrio sp.]
MSRREKIILAVTGIVAIVGLWLGLGGNAVREGLIPSGGGEAAQAGAMLASIKETALSPVELALLGAIHTPWPAKAFYDKPFAEHGVKPVLQPRYTGYVELGSGRLAVVDGMEYQVGDALESGGYKVVAIAPDQVVLESLVNGQRMTLPYEGQESRGR